MDGGGQGLTPDTVLSLPDLYDGHRSGGGT